MNLALSLLPSLSLTLSLSLSLTLTLASGGRCAYLVRFSLEISMNGPPGSVSIEACVCVVRECVL